MDQYDDDVDDDDVDVEDDDEDPRLYGLDGGINENWTWVKSPYFERLDELGDFKAATYELGGYCRPYIDFGISEIHKKYYYVIGIVINSNAGGFRYFSCWRVFPVKTIKLYQKNCPRS